MQKFALCISPTVKRGAPTPAYRVRREMSRGGAGEAQVLI